MRSILFLFALSGCTTKAAPLESCTQAVCPAGGHTYKFCSTQGAASCRYVGSDGRVFACSSCSNCATAANQVSSWCSSGATTSGTTTSGTTTSGTTTSGTTTSGTTTSGTTGGPLTGCNGLLMCYINCNGGAQSCYDDCDASATQDAIDLLNTLGTCIDTNCFQAINADGGQPYCTDATINDQPCNDCYARILGTNGVCTADQTACVNDKP